MSIFASNAFGQLFNIAFGSDSTSTSSNAGPNWSTGMTSTSTTTTTIGDLQQQVLAQQLANQRFAAQQRWAQQQAIAPAHQQQFSQSQFQAIQPSQPPAQDAPRAFNRFINASDLLEAFIREMGDHGVRQSEIMSMPLELFVHWLIMKAAEADGDPMPDGVRDPRSHPAAQQIPRCRTCGRFIARRRADVGVFFCSDAHVALFIARPQVAAQPLGGEPRRAAWPAIAPP